MAQQRMIDYLRDPAEWTMPQVLVEDDRIASRIACAARSPKVADSMFRRPHVTCYM
ncbi:hypothetical protein ACQEVF_45460 [Nonomuraea polychroma]|uniref:hypothetical protein n=1 Tax=Nonomuraea polychroma TaxID=46176 RepID=UPI003D8B91AB